MSLLLVGDSTGEDVRSAESTEIVTTDFAIMLPGKATLKVYERPPVGLKRTLGFEVLTAGSLVGGLPSGVRFLF